jgi:hypothetical protein
MAHWVNISKPIPSAPAMKIVQFMVGFMNQLKQIAHTPVTKVKWGWGNSAKNVTQATNKFFWS